MPQIELKPNSPEYAHHTARTQPQARTCDMPGCTHTGAHRAPKDRSLADHYWFCTPHAQDYNAAWDFFDGMAERDIESQIIQSIYGDRPTWRYDHNHGLETELHHKIHNLRYGIDENEQPKRPAAPTGNPELDALTVLGLTAPATFATIKTRYRELVKQYHPDMTQGQKDKEDLIKHVNMAYTILKIAYRGETTDI
jgi:hypothetical protein